MDELSQNSHPCVAIVIPVYNTEVHALEKALESVSAISFDHYLTVLVDDGSSSADTLAVLDLYSKRPNFWLIHQNNQGPAAARNKGISFARENDFDYIAFVDADDLVEPTYISSMIEVAERHGCDVVCGQTDVFTEYNSAFSTAPSRLLRLMEREESMIAQCRVELSPLVMGKLFKTSLFKEIRFDESLRYGDDTNFLLRLFFVAKSAAVISACDYHLNRVSGTNSICRPKEVKNAQILSLIQANTNVLNFDLSVFSKTMRTLVESELKHVIADAFLELLPRFSRSVATAEQKKIFKDLKRQFRKQEVLRFYKPYNRASRYKKVFYVISPLLYCAVARIYLRFRPGRYGIAVMA